MSFTLTMVSDVLDGFVDPS